MYYLIFFYFFKIYIYVIEIIDIMRKPLKKWSKEVIELMWYLNSLSIVIEVTNAGNLNGIIIIALTLVLAILVVYTFGNNKA
mgnify:FL=1